MSVRAKQRRRQRAQIDRLRSHASSRWWLLARFGVIGSTIICRFAQAMAAEQDRVGLYGTGAESDLSSFDLAALLDLPAARSETA